MKKFNFKALVLVVLALVLCFALVACNNDKTQTQTKTKDNALANAYFQALGDGVSQLGKNPIDKNKDLSAKLAVEVKIDAPEHLTLDLGVEAEVVYDRAATGTEKPNALSAARVTIKDLNGGLLNGNKGGKVIEVLYSFSEPTFIYAELCNQKLKLNFDSKGNQNGELVDYLTGFLAKKFKLGKKDISVDDLITDVATQFGPAFTLDGLANAIVGNALGLNLEELIGKVADLIQAKSNTIAGLLAEASGLLVDDAKAITKQQQKDGRTYWNARLGSFVNGLIGGIAKGILDEDSQLSIEFYINKNRIDDFALTAKTAPLGEDGTRYNLYAGITEFDIKETTATKDSVIKDSERSLYKEDYLVQATAQATVQEALGAVKLTLGELEEKADEGEKKYFSSICADISLNVECALKSFDAFKAKVERLIGDDSVIKGELFLDASASISLNDKKPADAAADWAPKSKGIAVLKYNAEVGKGKEAATEVAKVTYTQDANGVGTVNIWVDRTNKYIEAIVDNLMIVMIEGLYNSPKKAEHETMYTDAIKAMLKVIDGTEDEFQITGFNIQTLFINAFFGAKVKDKKIEKYNAAIEDKIINFVKTTEAALNDKFVKLTDKDTYGRVTSDAPTKADLLAKVGAAYDDKDGVQDAGVQQVIAEGKYKDRWVAVEKDSEGNVIEYTEKDFVALYRSGDTDSVFPTKFSIGNILGAANDVISYTAGVTNTAGKIAVATTKGLWAALFAYKNPESTADAKYDLGDAGVGYLEMGILETQATTGSSGINGYIGAKNSEELYASIYKGGEGAIIRMTDAGILPCVRVVELTGTKKGTGEYGYGDKDPNRIVACKNGDYKLEYAYVDKDNIGTTYFYQTGSTLTKEQAVLMWKVTAGTAKVNDVNNMRTSYNAAALTNCQQAIDNCYKEGIINVIGEMFEGTALIADCYDTRTIDGTSGHRLNGQKLFDKLLTNPETSENVYNVSAEIIPSQTALGAKVAIKKGTTDLINVSLSLTITTDTTVINGIDTAITDFNSGNGFDESYSGFKFDMTEWMPTPQTGLEP